MDRRLTRLPYLTMAPSPDVDEPSGAREEVGMSSVACSRDRVLCAATAGWIIWFVAMVIIATGAGSLSTWIALDSVARSESDVVLNAVVPVADGELVRVASTAPGWVLPEPIAAQHGHAHFTTPAPQQAGFHSWSALPSQEEEVDFSAGSLAVLEADQPWVGISIDDILADAPWDKIETSNPPRLYPAAHGGMLDLSRHALLICWCSIDAQQLPALRKWWSRLALPSAILLLQDDEGGAFDRVRQQLGDPILCLAGVDSISSLPVSEIEVIGVGAGNGAGWETATGRLEQLQEKGN